MSDLLPESSLLPADGAQSLPEDLRRELESSLSLFLARSGNFLLNPTEKLTPEGKSHLQRIYSTARGLAKLLDAKGSQNVQELIPFLQKGVHLDPAAAAVVARIPVPAPTTATNPLLVVDDRQSNRELLCEILIEQGHEVVDVQDGDQALQRLRTQAFDLVLLDIMMPIMDGYQVLQAIKQDRELRHIPVIMLSGLDEIHSVIRCIEMGAEDYLPKPFNPILLKARIEACLEKKRLRDQEQAYFKQLQVEQEKAERLLLNVLPKPIADRLKQGERMIVDSFPDVTVLFADLENFTGFCNQVPPAKVVQVLNEIFSRFDRLAEKHGLEKIKTIGDAYMLVGGVPTPRADHAEAVAAMALEILPEMEQINRDTGVQLNIRLGINSGPVVAGIIGTNKFIYDLWGDTVNTANRMESLCQSGTIHITGATYERIKHRFVCQPRGEVEVKGKGFMTTFVLRGKK